MMLYSGAAVWILLCLTELCFFLTSSCSIFPAHKSFSLLNCLKLYILHWPQVVLHPKKSQLGDSGAAVCTLLIAWLSCVLLLTSSWSSVPAPNSYSFFSEISLNSIFNIDPRLICTISNHNCVIWELQFALCFACVNCVLLLTTYWSSFSTQKTFFCLRLIMDHSSGSWANILHWPQINLCPE
jgi:hypothetical protein